MQLDDDVPIPVIAKSEQEVAKDAEKAVAYLKRTDNLDTVEALGLSTYLEDEDEQKDEEGSDDGDTAGGK